MLKIFLPWALSLVFALFIYQKVEDLLENPKSDNKPSFNSESHLLKLLFNLLLQKAEKSSLENTPDEWCDTESYEDLSNHPSVLNFNQWLKSYIAFK